MYGGELFVPLAPRQHASHMKLFLLLCAGDKAVTGQRHFFLLFRQTLLLSVMLLGGDDGGGFLDGPSGMTLGCPVLRDLYRKLIFLVSRIPTDLLEVLSESQVGCEGSIYFYMKKVKSILEEALNIENRV